MIKNIFFDFDGVLLDSMTVKENGFRQILKEYGNDKLDLLSKYHHENGSVSRFDKIRYFFKNIVNEEISEENVEKLCNDFSLLMKQELTNPDYLIEESINFVKSNYMNYSMHIVSGAEEKELNFLCKFLDISEYFETINGYPPNKTELISSLIKDFKYKKDECVLIGDSVNDLDAAEINRIEFYGYNNNILRDLSKHYIDKGCFRHIFIK